MFFNLTEKGDARRAVSSCRPELRPAASKWVGWCRKQMQKANKDK